MLGRSRLPPGIRLWRSILELGESGDIAVTTREAIVQVLQELPDNRLGEVLDFARFLTVQEEHEAWSRFGQLSLARAYGNDEPEYTEADLKSELDP
jgi:hypothetical protein